MALPNKTMVFTFDELRHAAATGARYIYIADMIPMEHKITFGSDCDLYPQTKENCGLDFSPMKYNGVWEDRFSNGIELKAENHRVEGLHFTNFDRNGSAIKGHVDNVLEVISCTFRDISINVHEPPLLPAPNITQTITGMCIGSHQPSNQLIITGNTFINCCHQSHRWGRPVYATGKHTVAVGNHFYRCANPLGLGAYAACHLEIRENVFDSGAWIYAPETGGDWKAPWAIGFGDACHGEVLNNVFRGMWSHFFRNDWAHNDYTFEGNDYTMAEPPLNGWAWYSGSGYMSREDWGKE